MRPRRLEPKFLEKIWGSTNLEPWFRNRGSKVGEVWFHDDAIPLLVKFLFTTDKLSVQVHPGDEYARSHNASAGKTEMWHVLAAEPGARIAAGFRAPLTATQMRAAAEDGSIENLLEWFDARAGDTFFIPAGTVHAIGAGLVMCEIQQYSDVTYRLYDYGRRRELHFEDGMAVSHLHPHAPRVSGDPLVRCDYFTTRRLVIDGGTNYRTGAEELLIVIGGQGQIGDDSTACGDVWRISGEIRIDGNVTVLATHTGR